MKSIPSLGFGLLAALLLARCAGAATLTVPCNADTWILGESGYSDNNNGGSGNFATGINAHGSRMRGLLHFNLSGIPANATITAVSLTLTQGRTTGTDATFALHRMLKSWTEGAGGQFDNHGTFASPGETTWNKRFQGSTSWGSPGGAPSVDFSAAESAALTVGTDSSYTFASTAGLVADVQAWVSTAGSNFGWLMKDQAEDVFNGSARRWNSRESGAGPSLVVDYTTGSSAAQPPTIAGVVHANNQIQFTFNAEANRTYAVESRSNLASAWATNLTYSVSPVATNFTFTETLSPTNKFYRIRTP